MGDPFDRGAGCESGGGVRGRRRSPMGGADDDLAVLRVDRGGLGEEAWGPLDQGAGAVPGILGRDRQIDGPALDRGRVDRGEDRKSTRLNSSHVDISYAVFCLTKK